MIRHVCFVVGLIALVGSPAWAGDWPSFRGPGGRGVAQGEDPPVSWSAEKNVKWAVRLPAPGNGSPIVSDGRVFLTCAEDQGRKRGLYCFDRKAGRSLWTRTVAFDKTMPTHKTNPYCGSTPAADGKCVVVWHGSAGLHCYGLDGRKLWSRDLGEFRHIWGYGSSPVLYKDRVILHAGPGKRVFVAAFDLATGKTIWQTDEPIEGDGIRNAARKYMGSWCTPVIASADGKDVIVCTMPTRVNGYDPATGRIVWTCDGIRGRKGDLAYTSPIIAGDVCVAMGGFGGPALGFTLGGSGNITASRRLWRVEPNPQRIGSGVFVDGRVYMANAGPPVLQCIDPKTGKMLWEHRPGKAAYWGSLVLAGGRLYVTDQDGTTLVFRPDPGGFHQISRNELKEHTNSTPAVSDGQLFFRTFERLWCIGK